MEALSLRRKESDGRGLPVDGSGGFARKRNIPPGKRIAPSRKTGLPQIPEFGFPSPGTEEALPFSPCKN